LIWINDISHFGNGKGKKITEPVLKSGALFPDPLDKNILAQKFIILRVIADPKPENAILDIDAQCPVMESDTDRSIYFNFFEMKGRMLGIFFQKFKVTASQLLYSSGERVK